MDSSTYQILTECYIGFPNELLTDMATYGLLQNIKTNEYLIKQGQYVRSLPIVLNGTIKVVSEDNGMPFLLYYINRGATCVISFAHLFGQQQATFSGIAETNSSVLLIPVAKAREWLLKYPTFSEIILNEYQKRYDDLLHTTKQVICFSLKDRLTDYLTRKTEILKTDCISISHQHIADDLGTSREVISRLLKKIEKDGQIVQAGRTIRLMAAL